MEKLPKLPKGNLIFVQEPIVKDFIEYCKKTYSDKIEKINIFLNEEYNDWQMSVEEKTPGHVWVPWFIPTREPAIIEDCVLPNKKLISRYKIADGKK